MPIHDWTRVDHGTFHDFRQGWCPAVRAALNNDVLPAGYSAMVEPHADRGTPDVLALEVSGRPGGNGPTGGGDAAGGGVGGDRPAESDDHRRVPGRPNARLRKTVVVRRWDDRVVALIEIVSPGNKSGRHGLRAFVEKVAGAIEHGLHVLVVDLFPPGPRDPNGLHPVIWAEFRDEPYTQPAGRPLTVVSYEVGPVTRAYIEPVAVGDALPTAPLLLAAGQYVNVPWRRRTRPRSPASRVGPGTPCPPRERSRGRGKQSEPGVIRELEFVRFCRT